MKSNTSTLVLVFSLLLTSFLCGCGSNITSDPANKWELVVAKDGVVYRINKQSGEVSLISGRASVLVQGTENIESKTNRVVEWPTIAVNDLGGILGAVKVQLKTNWRAGKFYFIFTALPYTQLNGIIRNASADAQFFVYLYDENGFAISTVPIKLADMQPAAPSTGRADAYEVNASLNCDLDTYSSMKSWSISRVGF